MIRCQRNARVALVLFFRMEGSAHASWNLDATLMAKGIELGGAHKLDMQLPLYAHP